MRLVVAAAIVDSLQTPTRLLACRRSRPEALAGRWELPGGKAEPGEEPAVALRRELAEELGVAARLGAEVVAPQGTWPIDAGLEMRVWWAELDDEPRVGETHDAVRWLGRGEFHDVAWLPADVAVVAALRRATWGGSDGNRTASGAIG